MHVQIACSLLGTLITQVPPTSNFLRHLSTLLTSPACPSSNVTCKSNSAKQKSNSSKLRRQKQIFVEGNNHSTDGCGSIIPSSSSHPGTRWTCDQHLHCTTTSAGPRVRVRCYRNVRFTMNNEGFLQSFLLLRVSRTICRSTILIHVVITSF